MPTDPVNEYLSETGFERFLRDYWQKDHLLVKGRPDRFASLFPLAALNRILGEHSFGAGRLRVFRAGDPVPAERYKTEIEDVTGVKRPRVDAGRLAAELRTGAMIGLSQVQDLYPPVARVAREFEYAFRETVNINAYIGFAESKGFNVHWDDHEVFVLQVSGRKLWRIYGKTQAAPMYRELLEGEQPPTAPVWQGVLESGDLLYLPRGCWHDAEGLDQQTVHLSVGIDCNLGVHVVSWLAREVRKVDFFRRDLPRLASPEDRREHSRKLRELLLERLDDGVVDRFLAADDAAATARADTGFPAPFEEGEAWIRWLPPRPVELRIEALGRFVEFEALGREWILARGSEPVLRLLAAERMVRLSELRERFSRDVPALEQYLDKWMVEGLIEWTAGRDC